MQIAEQIEYFTWALTSFLPLSTAELASGTLNIFRSEIIFGTNVVHKKM
jgi:hypothetical protein